VTSKKPPVDIPLLALTVGEAARAIGLGEHVFRREVLPQVRSVKVGRQRLVAVIELERWLYLNGEITDDD
jgi:hypothetical protein